MWKGATSYSLHGQRTWPPSCIVLFGATEPFSSLEGQENPLSLWIPSLPFPHFSQSTWPAWTLKGLLLNALQDRHWYFWLLRVTCSCCPSLLAHGTSCVSTACMHTFASEPWHCRHYLHPRCPAQRQTLGPLISAVSPCQCHRQQDTHSRGGVGVGINLQDDTQC